MDIARGSIGWRTTQRGALALSLILGSGVAAHAAVLYRLQEGGTLQRGCFPPCDCPLLEAPIAGSFELGLISVGDVFDFYEVTVVSWIAAFEPEEVKVTGSGNYNVSTLAGQQILDLTLTVDREPPEHYSSDYVPLTVPFPDIAVPISINGKVCFDTVIDVRARPTPRLGVAPDALEWDSGLEVVGYDVVQGSLTILHETGGSFEQATEACLADDLHASSLRFDARPLPGEGFWFLVRAAGSTYDTGLPSQVGSRDPGIAASRTCR